MIPVYLALGSNLGDRLTNLRRAIAALSPALSGLVMSSVYETPPWGLTEQPAFLNMAVKGETYLKPIDLLDFVKKIEREMGRTPSLRYGPRLIDLDILFYGDLVFSTPRLTIPHPQLHHRGFVLVPLSDLSPALIHPALGLSIQDLLEQVDRQGITIYEKSTIFPPS